MLHLPHAGDDYYDALLSLLFVLFFFFFFFFFFFLWRDVRGICPLFYVSSS